MPFTAMQAGRWISNPLPNEQNADAQADAEARKRGFCECGSQVGCSKERPTAQVENFRKGKIHLKHVGTKTIETTRLTLRKLELTDAEMMFRNWTCDDKVTRFLRWDAHKTIDDTKSMIQQWINNYQYDSTYYWGMYLRNGEMIGSIGITIISEYDFKGELGYKIGSRWWNQGYSSEAARAVIEYMFRNTDIERIDAFSSVENPASRKVMEKVGMHYVGLLRHYYKTRDGFHDCTLYEIIRNEWEHFSRESERGGFPGGINS